MCSVPRPLHQPTWEEPHVGPISPVPACHRHGDFCQHGPPDCKVWQPQAEELEGSVSEPRPEKLWAEEKPWTGAQIHRAGYPPS